LRKHKMFGSHPVAPKSRKRNHQNDKKRSFRRLLMEQLEDRRVLAAVSWTGSGGNLLWSNPANWSTNQLPGPTNDVTIDAPGNVTIVYDRAEATTVRSLSLADSLRLSSGSIDVAGTLSINPGNTLTVAGTGVNFAAQGAATIDGANIDVRDGAEVALPSAVSYSASNEGIGGSSFFRVSGAGSKLDLTSLSELIGTTGWGKGFQITATGGGLIDLSGITQIASGSINFRATGASSEAASRILLGQLESFSSTLGFQTIKASMEAKDRGLIEVDSLISLDGVDLLLNTTDAIETSALVSYTNGTLTADGVLVDLSNAIDVSRSTFILRSGGNVDLTSANNIIGANFDVRDGAVLVLPSASSYSASNEGIGGSGFFSVSGAGSKLDLASLSELIGTTGWGKGFQITATDGGLIDLSGITQIDAGSINFRATGASDESPSRILLGQLESFVSTLGFQTIKASMEARDAGLIEVDSLVSLHGVDLLLNTTTAIETSALVSYTNGTLTADGVLVDLSNAIDVSRSTFILRSGGNVDLSSTNNIDGANFDVRDGVILALPSVGSYIASNEGTGGFGYFRVSGAGSKLDLSSLSVFVGTLGVGKSLQITATDGGLIDLSGITQIDTGSINFRATGASDESPSRILLGQLESFASTLGFQTIKASMEARDAGLIEVDSLVSLHGVDLLLNTTATIETSALVSYTNGTLTADGVLVDLSNAIDVSRSTFVLRSGGNVDLTSASNINGANFDVRDGAVLVLPSASSYSASNEGIGVFGYFSVSGTGSKLDLASISELVGTMGTGRSFRITATDGGLINLSGIAQINTGSINFRATGASDGIASRIVLNELQTFASTLGFQTIKASIEASDSGIIEIPNPQVSLANVDINITPSSTLSFPTINLGTGAVLRGQGEFFGNVVNSGGSVVAGKMPLGLSIQGDYTQAATGRLVLAIDGAVGQNQYSRLIVAGEAQLAGTLEITRLNNFVPDPVDVYPVISAGTISGNFDTITGSEVAGGDITPQYGSNVVVLSRNFDSEPFDSFTYQNTVANQRVFFNVTEVSGGPVAFRIYDPAGQLVAYSAATPSSPDDGDFGPFVLGAVGNYDIRVHSASSAPVTFTAALNPAPLATRPAGFQQFFSGNINVPGATDVWEFDVNSGDQIRLSISEIIGANQALSFRLSDPNGRVLARHQVSSQTLGQVVIQPHFATIGGRYQLTVDGIGDDTAAYRFALYNSPAPFIAGFTPIGPQRTAISSLQVEFDRAMNAASFTPEDVVILGPNPVEVGPNLLIPQTSFQINPLSNRLFQIDIDPSLAVEGRYLVTIGPNILDLAGIPLSDAEQFGFEIDTRGPRIVSAIPTGIVQNHLRFVDVTFDSPIDAATFNLDDIALSGPTGAIGVTQIAELSNHTYRLHFPVQTSNGDFTLRIGPNIADPAGNLMDQNQNGIQGELAADVFEHLLSVSLPDLVAGAINAEGSLISNSPLTLSWQVSNIGARATVGPWTERVYLADSPTGDNRQLLGAFSFNQVLAPNDAALQRTRSITLPATSFSGDVYFAVEVDATNNIIESDESNLFVSTRSYAIPATLSLSFPASQVTEGGPSLQGTITRNGDPALPLVVSLSSSVSDQIVMPATVTIPAGQYSQRFDVSGLVDNILDGNVSTLVIASSDGFVSASRLLEVIDADRGTLTLSADVTTITEGESLTVTVRRSVASGQPLLVSLSTTFGSQWTIPASVLIPANEATAQFTIQTVDDLRSEKNETATLTATATGFDPVPFSMQIIDDDLPNLSIQLSRNSILENDTANPIAATVSRETVTGNSVRVRLNSSDPNRLVVPAEVTIPAGELSTRFFITPVDNQILDTSQSVVVRARGVYDSCGCTITDGFAEAAIEVIDTTTPSLLLETSQTFVREGVSPAGQITIRRLVASTDQPLTVTVSSSNPAKLTLPTSVTIPAGESSVQVAFSTISDRQTTGDEAITVSATAAGLTTANRVITVTDIDLPDLVVTETNWSASGFAGETISIGWTTRNNGQSSATGTWIERVFISSDNAVGDDILVGQYTFTGTLAHQQAYQRVANIELPSIPGDYWLVVQTDATDQVREGLETNNHGISISPIGVTPAYTATVSAAVEVAAANTPVLLTGSAVRPDGSPARNEPVSVHLTVRGMKRILPATTDMAGNFEVTFRPLPGEGGTYTIGAAQPGIPDVDAQDSFRLIGMRAEPAEQSVQLIEGAAQSIGSVVIRNLADTPLTGMTVEVLGAPANLQVSATLAGGATTLRSAGSLTLNYNASATDASILSGTFDLKISSQEAPAITVPVNFTVIPLAAQLAATPGSLTKGMLVGEQTAVEFTIQNNGGKETGPLDVLLPTGADWLSLATPATMASILPGASTSITLLLTPPADLELTAYNGSLIVRGDDTDVTVPFSFRAVSESLGDLQVTVVDEYFYFTEEKPLVNSATVTLRDPFTGEIVASSNMAAPPSTAEGESGPGVRIDAEGRVTFIGIPSGPYTLEVGSANHESYSNTIRVEAGTLSERQVFVSRNLVEYIWTVEEVEIEDRTRVTIEAVFETNVPAPVVTMQYREAGESEFKDGVVFDFADLPFIGNSKQIDIKLTNQGWIAAQGVAFDFGSHPFYEIIPLVDEIGTLPAKSEIIVPVILRRIADFSSFGEGEAPVSGMWAEGESARSGGAIPCTFGAYLRWFYICGEKIWVSSGIALFNFEFGTCPPGSASGRGGPSRPGRVTPVSTSVVRCELPPCFSEYVSTILCALPGSCTIGAAAGCATTVIIDALTSGVSAKSVGNCLLGVGICLVEDLLPLACLTINGGMLAYCLGDTYGLPTGAGEGESVTSRDVDASPFNTNGILTPPGYPEISLADLAFPIGGTSETSMRDVLIWNERMHAILEPFAYLYGDADWFIAGTAAEGVLTIFHESIRTTSDQGNIASEGEIAEMKAAALASGISVA
jgi:hypothetical protein